jgi:phenylacetate-CoA ligase
MSEKSLSRIDWISKQKTRIQEFLTNIFKDVPFYNKIFKKYNFNPLDKDLLLNFQKVPILTKSIIRENFNDLISTSIDKSELIKNSTGGSTGVPLSFFQNKNYLTIAQAIDYYVRDWWGILPYAKTAIIWGADREFKELSFKEKLYEKRSRITALNAFQMNDEDLHLFCKKLSTKNYEYLVGYSSALAALAAFIKNNNYSNFKFKGIRSSAEMLWPFQRELIENTFDTPVFDFYGSREINNLAAECPEEGNLHLISTWRYVEIVDDAGKKIPDGELGYITVTDLSNNAMPFVRYRNEDMGILSQEKCKCGRPSSFLKKLVGRSSDLIKAPNGDIIHGEFFTHLFYNIKGIKQFQVHQKELNKIAINYVSDLTLGPEVMDKMKINIYKKMGDKVNVIFTRLNSINIPKSGKHRFTISDV